MRGLFFFFHFNIPQLSLYITVYEIESEIEKFCHVIEAH